MIDARGQMCPIPVIRLARTAKGEDPGTTITVLADDPAARHDIPAWVRLKGHEVRVVAHGDHAAYEITLSAER